MTTPARKNLQRALLTMRARRAVYGRAELRYGTVMAALFPRGVMLRTVADHQRFGVLMQVVGKLVRYTARPKQGHRDSAHDLINYAAMLEELTP